MKSVFTLFLLVLCAGLFFIASCKNNNSEETPDPAAPDSIAIRLKAHSWRYFNNMFLLRNKTLLPYTLNNCLMDDRLDFFDNNLYLKDPGTELCAGQTQKKDSLSWKLIKSGKFLEIVNKGVTVNKEILKLVDDSLYTQEITPLGDTQVFLYLRY